MCISPINVREIKNRVGGIIYATHPKCLCEPVKSDYLDVPPSNTTTRKFEAFLATSRQINYR